MFTIDNSVLILVDVQQKLITHIAEKEQLIDNIKILIGGLNILGVPIIWVEQNPEKMGATVDEIETLLDGYAPISKSSFSCCGEPAFINKLKLLERNQAIVMGIESHVCVYQTVIDLLDMGLEVEVMADCVSSRSLANKDLSLQKMRDHGANCSSLEMLLFELLVDFKHEKFKEISRLIK